jgi:glycosyltransferase involved in cell wall biosynthesis
VIPTLGNHEALSRVLDGFERQQCAAGTFEVIVVADAADPDPVATRAVVARRRCRVALMNGARPGASCNRNTGWHAARGGVVLFCDNDTIPAPDLIAEHLAWHHRFPAEEVAVLGFVRWAGDVKVTPFMTWLEQGIQFDFGSISGIDASWAHLYTANCSIKRELLARAGGFDEERLPYLYEDLDWAYRARKHGLRVVFNRRAVVDHWREMTVAYWQARARQLAASEWTFCQLHPDVPPWFHGLFSAAAAVPPGGRRSAMVTRLVPQRAPWLGRWVWDRAGLYWRQQLAAPFLEAWNAAAARDRQRLQPAAVSGSSGRASSSSAGS